MRCCGVVECRQVKYQTSLEDVWVGMLDVMSLEVILSIAKKASLCQVVQSLVLHLLDRMSATIGRSEGMSASDQ